MYHKEPTKAHSPFLVDQHHQEATAAHGGTAGDWAAWNSEYLKSSLPA